MILKEKQNGKDKRPHPENLGVLPLIAFAQGRKSKRQEKEKGKIAGAIGLRPTAPVARAGCAVPSYLSFPSLLLTTPSDTKSVLRTA